MKKFLLVFAFLLSISILQLLLPKVTHAQTCGDLYQNKTTFCSVIQIINNGTAPYTGCHTGEQCFIGSDVGQNDCNWVQDTDGLKFCFGGFANETALQSSHVEFRCSQNCGGAGGPTTGGPPFSAGDVIQTHSLAGAPTAPDGKGGVFSCVMPNNLDSSVVDAVRYQIDALSAACGVAGVGEFIGITALTGGGGGIILQAAKLPLRLTVAGGLTAASPAVRACLEAVNNYRPTVETKIVTSSGTIHCLRELPLNLETFLYETPGYLCATQNSPDPKLDGIQTAIGCIPIDTIESTISFFVRWTMGIGGGIAILLIIIASFQIMTSGGDKYKLQSGREMLTAALAGLLLAIFAILLVQIFGQNILKLF